MRGHYPPQGDIAQLVERLLCKQEVTSSNLVVSTSKVAPSPPVPDFIEGHAFQVRLGACPSLTTQ